MSSTQLVHDLRDAESRALDNLREFARWITERHAHCGGVTEIRIIGERVYSGWFDAGHQDELVRAVLPKKRSRVPYGEHPCIGEANIYFSMQAVHPDLLARSANRITLAKTGHSTSDGDIVGYALFAVDVDPERIAGISVTTEEKRAAYEVKEHVRAWFAERGIRCIEADSGNGYHLLIPTVDYSDVARAVEKAKALLTLLAGMFDTSEATIDTGVVNASRVLKLYGTKAVKGDDIERRPHRWSGIDLSDVPEDIDLFGVLASEIDAADVEGHEPPETAEELRVLGSSGWDRDRSLAELERVLRAKGLTYRRQNKGGRELFVFEECPVHTDDDGHTYECCVMVEADGRYAASCKHDANAHWPDFRRAIGWDKHTAAKASRLPRPADKRPIIPPAPAVPFPVACLPSPVGEFVSDAARAIGCDPSYIALPLLAGLASAIGNTRRILLKYSWCEPAILWGAIVGDSGTLKSPALELALRPIRRRQQTAMKAFVEAMEAYKIRLMEYEKELATWKQSKMGGEPPLKPEEPVAVRCWCDDVTIEALAVLLQQNPRGLLLKRDELAGWLGSFDRYAQGKGSDAAKWLEVFGARPILVDRKSGQTRTVYVPRAAVSVTGGIQPETLRRALGVEHRENGLAARLLLACPTPQAKRWTEADISREIESRMEALFDRLYSLPLVEDGKGDAGPLDLPLSAEAKMSWVDFYNAHAKEQEGLTGDLAAVWSKLEGYAARLALIVHLVRWAARDRTLDNPNVVDERSIEAGVQLSRWFGQEAERVYAILRESEEDRERRRLVEAIERKGGAATVRDLQRTTRMFASAEAAEAALEELCQTGYGRWEDLPIAPTGGRPTRRFVLAARADADEPLDSG